ncbi:DUF2254 domain-containing protein [Marinobacterium lutimaris]|uniref:Uncharacterized membrane protein n=1 Tax=Marinobacterium lutimaris TaxID=568106 RepID=A0A1H6DVG9_9GAMM|nr:DUF2254 domain-containing protein [Marinobacterium lutimaris]SEG88716.1 Uncharacterized membrane protein [Marinobacterium lutimaris]
MGDRLRFYIRRIRERLWVRPLTMGVLSVAVVFLAKMADTGVIGRHLPLVTQASVETLLAIISASMLVIATFAVASMVAAYASASSTATPRSFSLIIADDISQNALSTFIGAFIFSIVALIALKNGYYDRAGRFALFVITVLILAMVILTFVRWVDCIARLGRLTSTVEKVEAVTAAALQRRRRIPHLRGTPADGTQYRGQAVYGKSIGYVQRIEITALQAYAEKTGLRIQVAALPGAFSAPGRALAYITVDQSARVDFDQAPIAQAFVIGVHREFDEDPRFGLVVLSEIASRALSPAVNDPGTAIGIIGSFLRLFALWAEPVNHDDLHESDCDRVAVPEIAVRDMFDDAFTAIARAGAGTIEVAGRLQKAFASLATLDDAAMREAATQHSRLALARSEGVLVLADDMEAIRRLATFALSVQPGVAKR